MRFDEKSVGAGPAVATEAGSGGAASRTRSAGLSSLEKLSSPSQARQRGIVGARSGAGQDEPDSSPQQELPPEGSAAQNDDQARGAESDAQTPSAGSEKPIRIAAARSRKRCTEGV